LVKGVLSLTTGKIWLASLLAGLGFAGVYGAARARDFAWHIRDLQARLAHGPVQIGARADLPPEVAALARRMGAQTNGRPVRFTQVGHMWSAPNERPVSFTASQAASTTNTGFIWHAHMGPGGPIQVIDYYVDSAGGLEVSAFGIVSLTSRIGGADMAMGEVLRYLAELPVNPDAILMNRSLKWSVISASEIAVSAAVKGADPVTVTFTLDPTGLPQSVVAVSRPYLDRGTVRPLPWTGRFSRYERFEGRLLPRNAEVAWIIEGREFIYWRGVMQEWAS
jgi:hypothetical protein